jgi:hypothetical protein
VTGDELEDQGKTAILPESFPRHVLANREVSSAAAAAEL